MVAGTQKYVHVKCLRRWQDSVQRHMHRKDRLDGAHQLPGVLICLQAATSGAVLFAIASHKCDMVHCSQVRHCPFQAVLAACVPALCMQASGEHFAIPISGMKLSSTPGTKHTHRQAMMGSIRVWSLQTARTAVACAGSCTACRRACSGRAGRSGARCALWPRPPPSQSSRSASQVCFDSSASSEEGGFTC